MEHRHDDETDDCNQRALHGGQIRVGILPLGEVHHADQGSAVAHHKAAVFQPNDGDEQADAGGDGRLDGFGNGPDDGLAQANCGNDDEQDTGNKHNDQGLGVAVAHTQHHSIGKEGVQAHTRRLREGKLGVERHQNGSDKGTQAGANEHTVGDFPCQDRIPHDHKGVRQDLRVQDQDIGDGDKGCNTSQHFRTDIGTVLFQFKIPLHDTGRLCSS